MKKDKKTGDTVGMRLDESFVEPWNNAIKATGVSDSDFLRACVEEGYKKATARLVIARKKAEKRLFFNEADRPFETPLTPFSGSALAAGLV